jgi:hypothetical protein
MNQSRHHFPQFFNPLVLSYRNLFVLQFLGHYKYLVFTNRQHQQLPKMCAN